MAKVIQSLDNRLAELQVESVGFAVFDAEDADLTALLNVDHVLRFAQKPRAMSGTAFERLQRDLKAEVRGEASA